MCKKNERQRLKQIMEITETKDQEEKHKQLEALAIELGCSVLTLKLQSGLLRETEAIERINQAILAQNSTRTLHYAVIAIVISSITLLVSCAAVLIAILKGMS